MVFGCLLHTFLHTVPVINLRLSDILAIIVYLCHTSPSCLLHATEQLALQHGVQIDSSNLGLYESLIKCSHVWVFSVHPIHKDLQFWGEIRSEEHTSELQSLRHLVCRLL